MKGLLLLIVVALASAKHVSILTTSQEAKSAWRKSGRAANGPIEFRLNFQVRNQDWLDQTSAEVSNPDHVNYGKYLSTSEVTAMIAPTPAEKKVVFDFLNANGVSYMDSGMHLKCKSTVQQVEKLFATRLYRTRNVAKKSALPHFSVKALDGFNVPDELLTVLRPEYPIGGPMAVLEPPRKLAVFPKKNSKFPSSDGSVDCAVVPQTLETQYEIDGAAIMPPFGKITQSVSEFSDDDSYSPADLKAFSTSMEVNIEGKVVHHGPFNFNPPDAESTLDIQYIASTGRNGTSSFWVVAGWLTELLQDLQAAGSPPEIMSISWGADERQEGKSVNEGIDKLFQALGVSGVTFLVASGDSGAGGQRGGCPQGQYQMNPGYPATSPWILSVGATMYDSFQKGGFKTPFCKQSATPCAGSGHEVPAWVSNVGFSTGGGFSTYAALPSWQAARVEAYNNDSSIPKPPTSTGYNPQNRGFPDVSAQGWNVFIDIQGSFEEIGGTSASSPIFAGMLSLLNDHLRKNGKPVLGFVNPLIYKMAEAVGVFQKIGSLSTNNNGGCTYGYTSNPTDHGWDPVTGLGTFRYKKAIAWLDQNIINKK